MAQFNAQETNIRQQRFELQQEERRRLATFLTPVQQAQYFGLQEQLRVSTKQLRQSGSSRWGGPPRAVTRFAGVRVAR